MPSIQIHHQGKIIEERYSKGESLLSILRDKQRPVSSPCGGNGTCGKCKVEVEQEGTVLACSYFPDQDIKVILPNTSEAQILSAHMASSNGEPNNLGIECDNSYGLAIDIGTTSVVFYWVNLITGSIDSFDGIENPQVKFGADVISRINHCSKDENLLELQRLIVDAMQFNINAFIAENEAAKLKKISVAANACMLHLLCGVNPMPMALAPFVAPFTEAKTLKSSSLGLTTDGDVEIDILPSASAFVGADIVAGIASLNPPDNIKNYLFLDIGTNGEMAVVTPSGIVSCATAAGPAFEAANIQCGMGAFEGAIAEYGMDGYKTIEDKPALGICGSGLIDLVAFLLETKKISADGNLAEDFIIVPEEEAINGSAVVLTPQDIREVQLAKSAIYTGIKLLLQEAGLSFEELDSVYLAGGFGNYMNPKSACKIGLLPSNENVPVVTVGNTSGAGAVLHVSKPEFVSKMEETLNSMRTIDLADHPDFELEFAMNMYF